MVEQLLLPMKTNQSLFRLNEMIHDFSPEILDLNTIDEARQTMQDIHCTDAGIK